jgi:hypothetical protein
VINVIDDNQHRIAEKSNQARYSIKTPKNQSAYGPNTTGVVHRHVEHIFLGISQGQASIVEIHRQGFNRNHTVD